MQIKVESWKLKIVILIVAIFWINRECTFVWIYCSTSKRSDTQCIYLYLVSRVFNETTNTKNGILQKKDLTIALFGGRIIWNYS